MDLKKRPPRIIFIGFDPREAAAFAVTCRSIREYDQKTRIVGLVLDDLRECGLYTRPTERRLGRIIDKLSVRDDYDGAISTEFAISRFLVPELVRRMSGTWRPYGWALFMDCDMLVRADVGALLDSIEYRREALLCVKHRYTPSDQEKMDGQLQTSYPRKNWSSFMAFNVDHPANELLTPELVNSAPGRDLHRFCWLKDEEIGGLPEEWNWLVGHSSPKIEPKNVHFTQGGPWFEGFRNVAYADEWRTRLRQWARSG